jgi:hypothetical protein
VKSQRLPVHQVRTGQPRPAELFMQPQAEVMQGQRRRQARLKSAEVRKPFPIEAEDMRAFLLHRLSTRWRTPATQRRSRLGQGARLCHRGGQLPWAPEVKHLRCIAYDLAIRTAACPVLDKPGDGELLRSQGFEVVPYGTCACWEAFLDRGPRPCTGMKKASRSMGWSYQPCGLRRRPSRTA